MGVVARIPAYTAVALITGWFQESVNPQSKLTMYFQAVQKASRAIDQIELSMQFLQTVKLQMESRVTLNSSSTPSNLSSEKQVFLTASNTNQSSSNVMKTGTDHIILASRLSIIEKQMNLTLEHMGKEPNTYDIKELQKGLKQLESLETDAKDNKDILGKIAQCKLSITAVLNSEEVKKFITLNPKASI